MKIWLSFALALLCVLSTEKIQAQGACTEAAFLGEGQGNPPPCLRPLLPLFTCLDRNTDGTFTARMGFDSQNELCCNDVPQSERILPIGNTHPFYRNYFTFSGPIPAQCLALGASGFDCGQPTVFPAGQQSEVFNVTWDGAPMSWTLRTFSAFSPFFYESSVLVAGDSTQACSFDCAGTPFGTLVVDRCGICGGDGQSCLGCDEKSQSAELIALDSSTLRQKHLVDSFASKLLKLDNSRRSRVLAKRAKADALKAYTSSWSSIWTLPTVSVTCSNSTFCTQTSNEATIQSIDKASQTLLAISATVIARLSKFDTARNIKKYKKKSGDAYNQSITESSKIIPFQSVCS